MGLTEKLTSFVEVDPGTEGSVRMLEVPRAVVIPEAASACCIEAIFWVKLCIATDMWPAFPPSPVHFFEDPKLPL